MKDKFEWLEGLPELDLFEIATPTVEQEIDREDIPEFKIAVQLRKPQDFAERVYVLWQEDVGARNKVKGQKAFIVYAVYVDEKDKPIFKSKPLRVRLKRRVN